MKNQQPNPDGSMQRAAEEFLRELTEHFHGEKPPAIPDPGTPRPTKGDA